MRKIQWKDMKKAALLMADAFQDYPLYSVFFKDDEKKKRKIFYFFWYRLYTRKNYTYVNDDLSVIVSFKEPGDRNSCPIPLFLYPPFGIAYLFCVGLLVLLKVGDFSKMEESLLQKHYRPETDSLAQVIYIAGTSGESIQTLKEVFWKGNDVYLETHTPAHVRFYRHLGAEVLEKAQWRGVDHYLLVRRGNR